MVVYAKTLTKQQQCTRIIETSVIVSNCWCLPDDSIRDATFTVSPNKQYRGIVKPTTPAQHGPILDYLKRDMYIYVCNRNSQYIVNSMKNRRNYFNFIIRVTM